MGIAVLFAFFSACIAIGVALGIAFFERNPRLRWLMASGMALLGAESAFAGLAIDAVLPEEAIRWQVWRCLAQSFLPGLWLMFSLSYARSSTEKLLPRRRFLAWGLFLAPVAVAVGFRDHLLTAGNQVGPEFEWVFGFGQAGMVLNLFGLLGAIAVLMNLERTFRASVGTMRWRIKFMVLGIGVLFVARAYTSVQTLLFHSVTASLQTINSCGLIVACLFVLTGLSRTAHFAVEVYPSDSVLRGSFTLLLAGIYLFVVGLLARLVDVLGGYAAFQLKALLVLVSLVLLALMLVSDRLRLQMRRIISRHLQRPIYDYRAMWRLFLQGTASKIEETDLSMAIVRLISEIFQALSVTLWRVDEGQTRLVYAGSTSLSIAQAQQLTPAAAEAAPLISALRIQADPIDVEAAREPWGETIRRSNPPVFPNGAHRFCIRLAAGEELVGLMVLGDRVGGLPFSLQDLDLLKSVTEQAATSLLNIRLSQRLSQSKQMEAFQTMSAFFVHDLKNTASTLSLTLQNLPIHYQDPEFREDALRGIADTVNHINDLIRRLGMLRQELVFNYVPCDLNELVSRSLKTCEESLDVKLTRNLGLAAKVNVDPAQIQKVITNLVINAKEASDTQGEVRVETSRANGWAILSVIDQGCGMSSEFIQNRLFRPFQTTKRQGLGIGMFHCKTIVEAHRGRMEVESEPGRGTVVRVMLPLEGKTALS